MTFLRTLSTSFKLWTSTFWGLFPLMLIGGIFHPDNLHFWIDPKIHPGAFFIALIATALIVVTVYCFLYARLGKNGKKATTPPLSRFVPVLILSLSMVLIFSLVFGGGFLLAKATGLFEISILAVFICMVLFVYLFVAFPLVILDKVAPFTALQQSIQLVRGNWWFVFGLFIIFLIFQVIIGMVCVLLGKVLPIAPYIPLIAGKVLIFSLIPALQVIVLKQLRGTLPMRHIRA